MACLFSCDKMVSFRVIQMVVVKWLSCVFFSFIADKLNKKARFFQFAAPFSDESAHSISQAVILEGKYWKRRLDAVSREFKKWRRLYKEKVCYFKRIFNILKGCLDLLWVMLILLQRCIQKLFKHLLWSFFENS